MNKLSIIVLVVISQLLPAIQLYSCTCGVIPQTLCESVNGKDYQEVVLVKVISFNFNQGPLEYEDINFQTWKCPGVKRFLNMERQRS